ncbi:hypothetical protein [Clostridium oryzae]|uniref:Uncharacterized protein n=1 Tax=Clostridium oryzae TaxID=1450648 RepID=A0A1V4IJD1_9CLOT|nr:hypothetical protein [Clostridium oryzae]OPJ59934.1 hypothetical protein CLORY_30260 [Clostridium oryzae]
MKNKKIAVSIILCIFVLMVNVSMVEAKIHKNNSKKYCLTSIHNNTPSDIDIGTIK